MNMKAKEKAPDTVRLVKKVRISGVGGGQENCRKTFAVQFRFQNT